MSSEMLLLILVFLTSLSISIYATPALIRVAILKRLRIFPPKTERSMAKEFPP
jgi:hypothetical protein